MRAMPLILVAFLATGCWLNQNFAKLDDYPLTYGSSDASTDGTTGAPTSTIEPVQTNTGPVFTSGNEPVVLAIESVTLDSYALEATGPLRVTATTTLASEVEVQLDDGPRMAMQHDGDEMWSFTLVIDSAVPDEEHQVTVFASDGTDSVMKGATFTLKKPATGSLAWSTTIDAPPGTTNDLAFTADGDVIEAGGMIVDGEMRPSLRRRSIVNGATVWAEPTLVLWPDVVGEVAAVAGSPDGTLWIAANVAPPGQTPRPRFAHVDPSGQLLGPFSEGVKGQIVFDVATDDDEGCVGVGSTPAGDHTEGRLWLIDAENGVKLSKSWVYAPGPNALPYDVIFEGVALVGSEIIAGGHTTGLHADLPNLQTTRATAVRFSRATGDVLAVPWLAPVDGPLVQSRIHSLSPDGQGGWVSGGEACDMDCSQRTLELGGYSSAGERVGLVRAATESWGNSVVVDSQARILSAVTFKTNDLDGHLLFHETGPGDLLVDVPYPTSATSVEEMLTDAVDGYDRIVRAGYAIGEDGQPRPIIERVHP